MEPTTVAVAALKTTEALANATIAILKYIDKSWTRDRITEIETLKFKINEERNKETHLRSQNYIDAWTERVRILSESTTDYFNKTYLIDKSSI